MPQQSSTSATRGAGPGHKPENAAGDDYSGAFLDKCQGGSPADAGAAACYQSPLTFRLCSDIAVPL